MLIQISNISLNSCATHQKKSYNGIHDNVEFEKGACYSNELQHSTEILCSDKTLLHITP